MRSLLGKVALALALAISTIAGELPARSAQAASADETSVAILRCGGAALRVWAARACPRSRVSAPSADDPATDSESDTLGSERAAPEAVPALGGTALDAPQSSRVQHRATPAEDAVTRAILPVVQPPRG